MVFLYANYATAPPVDDAICISKRIRPRRRDRAKLLPNILPIQPLINEVGEVNDTILHNKRPATVFVHASSNIEVVLIIGRNKLRLFPFNDAVDEVSALLLRLRFSPVDRVAIQSNLVKPDRIGHHEI